MARWKMGDEVIRDLLRRGENIGGAGVARRGRQAVNRPRLPARPRAGIGIALIGLAIDELAGAAVEISELESAAIRSNLVRDDRAHVTQGAVVISLVSALFRGPEQ